MKVGRNDPCPCGSGRKYKKCCGAGTDAEKFIPFPGVGDFGGTGRLDADGHPLTYLESLGTPNLATATLKGLQAALDGREFANMDELERFAEAHVAAERNRPLEDFLGLSPDQMHRILSGRFSELRGFLSFGTGLAEGDLKFMPLLEDAVYILRALVAGPLKATQTGKLPKALVLAWWEELGQWREPDERLRAILKPRNEAEAWGLFECRLQLMAAGLLALKGTRFELTREGRGLIEPTDLDGLLGRLVKTIGWGWDWNEVREAGRDFNPFSQSSFAFNLHLLGRLARDWTYAEDLVSAYLRAFPLIRDQYREESVHDTVLRDIELVFGLTHWPRLLGLVEDRGGISSYDGVGKPPPHEYRVTPLFDRLIRLDPGK